MATQIPLTNAGFAIVDDCDAAWALQYTWRAVKRGRVTYASRCESKKRGSCVYMHREILPGHPRVDHENRDGLDNRKSNLRPCTRAQNAANAGIAKNNKSGFRGVSKHRSGGWVSYIKVNQQKTYLGYFKTPEQAAAAYDQAALSAFGEFAFTNFADCRRPELCGGYGAKHCGTCERASRESEAA